MVSPKKTTPIHHIGGQSGLGHMLKVNAVVAGRETLLIFDTGIGINLISQSLCETLKCEITGAVTGKRMTGQEVTIPTTQVDSLSVAGATSKNLTAGVLDLSSFVPDLPEFAGVEGYLSLTFFEKRPFTLDYLNNSMIIENEESMQRRLRDGLVVPISKHYQDSALTIHVQVITPLNKILTMQLDLGTNILTISDIHLDSFQENLDQSKLKKQTVEDETGFKRVRVFGSLDGWLGLNNSKLRKQLNPRVMFETIIYDGIIGNDFFKDRVVTYDLPNSRIIIGK